MKPLFSLLLLLVPAVLQASEAKPHVLFIAIDDMRPDIGCYGNPEIVSPNMDRLASDGTVFLRAYCQQALCGPSRVSLMTGVHPDGLGIWSMSGNNIDEWREARPGITSLTEQFRHHGYTAIGFGKIYDNRLGLDRDHSWDAFTQGWKGGYADPENRKTAKGKGQGGKPATRAAFEGIEVPDKTYTDGSNTALALEVLEHHNAEDPLFLAIGFAKPHLPFVAPKKYWDLYQPDQLTLATERNAPEGGSEYLLSRYKEIFSYAVPNPVPATMERSLVHGYYACVSYIDAQIGKLLEALKAKGMYENTLIVLWGDHGFKLGDHGEWAKHTNLELDARVPLIIKAPGRSLPASKTTALAELVDVFPTMCELAGLPIPESVEGLSLVPVMAEPTKKLRPFALTQYPRQKGTMAYSIRTEAWRYHEVRNRRTGKIVAQELYALPHTSLEQENIAQREKKQTRAHAKLLDRYLRTAKKFEP